MRDFSTPRTFILSAYQGRAQSEDLRNHAELASDLALEGLPYQECQGSWEGQYEQGFIVVGAENTETVRALAEFYNQQSYLVIAENDRIAYDVDTVTGYHKHLGRFHAVGCDEPDVQAWTLLDGVFFTTTDEPGVDLPGGF